MVQGSTETGEKYKPSEHGGLKEDGTPDKRVSSEHGFGNDHERAVEAGKAGGSAEKYKPTEHDGLKEDGTPDKRTDPNHGFGGDRERASELGKQGGSK